MEAFCDGHNAAFAFFGGVPRTILYDNTKLAVAKTPGRGTAGADAALQPSWNRTTLFADRFGRPARVTTRGKSKGSWATPGDTSSSCPAVREL